MEVLVRAVRGKHFDGIQPAQTSTFKNFLSVITSIQALAQEVLSHLNPRPDRMQLTMSSYRVLLLPNSLIMWLSESTTLIISKKPMDLMLCSGSKIFKNWRFVHSTRCPTVQSAKYVCCLGFCDSSCQRITSNITISTFLCHWWSGPVDLQTRESLSFHHVWSCLGSAGIDVQVCIASRLLRELGPGWPICFTNLSLGRMIAYLMISRRWRHWGDF
jgi:hypothetical protein